MEFYEYINEVVADYNILNVVVTILMVTTFFALAVIEFVFDDNAVGGLGRYVTVAIMVLLLGAYIALRPDPCYYYAKIELHAKMQSFPMDDELKANVKKLIGCRADK